MLKRSETRRSVLAVALSAVLLSTAIDPVLAVDAPDAKPALWIITFGNYGVFEPKAEGSKAYQITGRPIFNVRQSTDREWLSLPNDSIDYELIETDQLRAGPVVNGRLGRTGSTADRGSRELSLVGHLVSVSLEAGAFVDYWPVDWLRTRVEVRAAAVGGAGVISDLNVDAVWRPNTALTVNAGPRLSIANGAFMDTYYGVSAAQAATLRVSKFDADAGVRSYGVGVGFKYKFTPRFSGLGFAEYQRLAGSAVDSPLIASLGTPNQVSVGLGASYDFHLDW